jgi:DHA2 family multidrug resistance protein
MSAEPAPTVTGSKVGITLAVMLAALTAVLDVSIVNVALPDIRASFGTPLDQIGWVATGYMMSNVVVIPMTGWLQRRFGYRRYFVASVLWFTAASSLCGLSWNLSSLVVFRVLQGLGGGAIIPTSQAVLFDRYPRSQHAVAGALFGIGAVTGPLLGPTVGGYLIDWANWHWIFYVNLPIGLLAAFLAQRFIEEPGFQPRRVRLDAFGVVLLTLGMASLQYVLEEGNRESWWESHTITACAWMAAICLITFVVHELETEHPLVELRTFQNWNYALGTVINLLIGVAIFSGAYLFSLYCGSVLHYSAVETGRVFLAAGALQFFLMPVVGRLTPKVDSRVMVGVGVALMSLGLWWNGELTSDVGFRDLVWLRMLQAGAVCFVFVPLTVITLSELPPEQRGTASGLFSLTRELGGSIGTAWMGLLLDNRSHVISARLREQVTPFSAIATQQYAQIHHGLGRVAQPTLGVYEVFSRRIELQALAGAFNRGFSVIAVAFVFSLALVVAFRRPNMQLPPPNAH